MSQDKLHYEKLDTESKRYLAIQKNEFYNTNDFTLLKLDVSNIQTDGEALSIKGSPIQNLKSNSVVKEKNGLISWYGESDKYFRTNMFVIHKRKNIIQGKFTQDGIQYNVIPIGAGYHVYTKSSNIKDEKCANGELNLKTYFKKPKLNNSQSRALNCAQRILFAITPLAKSTVPDVPVQIQVSVNWANLAYQNSGLNHKIEIALIYDVNYVESDVKETCWNGYIMYGIYKDLCRFQDDDEGYMDLVHYYRYLTHADICMLMVGQGVGGGQAFEIDADEDEAFARARILKSSSLPHEIGHLHGCRHDRFADDGDDFNHGFVYLGSPIGENAFRTVMAYNDECAANDIPGEDCPRVEIFSTPNQNWNGIPAGLPHNPPSLGHNNTQQIQNQKGYVSSFRTIQNSVYTSFENWHNQEYVYLSALEKIENSIFSAAANYTINSGAQVFWRTEKEINLLPGFIAKQGSVFQAKITSVCEQPY